MMPAVPHETAMVKYRGVAFEDGDRWWIIPPLSAGQLRDPKIMEHLDAIIAFGRKVNNPPDAAEGGIPEAVGTILDVSKMIVDHGAPVVHAALLRNYPQVTLEEVIAFLNFTNHDDATTAAIGRSSKPAVKSEGEIALVVASRSASAA